jgi:hypothetical protein
MPSRARAFFTVSQLMLKIVMVIPGDACSDHADVRGRAFIEQRPSPSLFQRRY